MSNQLELDWLAEERPAPLPLDAGTTERTRAQLLSYAADGGARRRTRRPLHRRVLGVAVSSTALAGVACVAVLATQASTNHAPKPSLSNPRLGGAPVLSASAKRLNHLSAKLADFTAPVGDATLVLRTQSYPNSPGITGADLYTDSGDYYYSPTFSGLPAVIKADDTVNIGTADQETRDIAAAQAALSGPIDTARQQMSVANLDPGVKPQAASPTAVQSALAKLPAVMRQQLEQKLKLVAANDANDDLQSVISQENGMIWGNSMDALLAGAGNPQVRAGVLKLLATIPQITVTQGTQAGQPTLDLTASLQSSKQGLYQEQLILNADTGVPIGFVGGNQGQTPSVTVDYKITRVTVADIENGSYTG